MSDKDRKKKHHEDVGKKNRRMKRAVKARSRARRRRGNAKDEVDTVKFKRGSANDRSRAGAP
jgi:hypothetical protein